MIARLLLLGVVVLIAGSCICGTKTAVAAPAEREEPQKRGTVAGVATAKGGHWIEVRADGEEKARRYYCGSDRTALAAVKGTEVGSRVRLSWRYQEVFRVVKIEVLRAPVKE